MAEDKTNENHNPYYAEDGTLAIRKSVVAFVDILGYREMAISAARDNQEREVLAQLHTALSAGRKWLDPDAELPALPKDIYVIKAFTDNIVIAWPINDDAETELGSSFSSLAWFQLEMVNAGFFVRGAISIGNIFVDDIAVFGGALNEAYEGETRLARDPRIVLTPSAATAVQKHLGYYRMSELAPQNRDLLRDADGQYFLNYLDDTVLIAPDEAGPNYGMLALHRQRIEERLTEYRSDPTIWSKYAWVARYHNYFCDLNQAYFDESHKIDVLEFDLQLTRIVDPSS
jgi:hypothetical protein